MSVEAAWERFVAELPLRRRAVRTPRECAAVAIERGFPAEPVETLTETFERVRCGAESGDSTDYRSGARCVRGYSDGDRR